MKVSLADDTDTVLDIKHTSATAFVASSRDMRSDRFKSLDPIRGGGADPVDIAYKGLQLELGGGQAMSQTKPYI